MIQDQLDQENEKLSDVKLEDQEEANLKVLTQSNGSFIIPKILLFLIAFVIIIIALYFSGYFITNENNINNNINNLIPSDLKLFNQITANLTKKELNLLSNQMSIVTEVLSSDKSNFFTPLFRQIHHNSNEPVSLDKVSFVISSSPASSYLCKLYLDIWSTSYGSKLVKESGIKPLTTVYWRYQDIYPENISDQKFINLENYTNFPMSIKLIKEKSYHRKWFFMASRNIRTVPPTVEWFYIMDDDTLPFLDRVLPYLSQYESPLTNSYLIHSPGERISGTHLGNGGGGFILSRRALVEMDPHFRGFNKNISRRLYNGDIRFDMCYRTVTKSLPILDYGLFHMDSKCFKGDLTGFVEGFMDRMNFKALHHLEKWVYFLFPRPFFKMMESNNLMNVRTVHRKKIGNVIDLNFNSFSKNVSFFSQAAHFARASAISGDLFLKKFAVLLGDNKKGFYFAILNMGYSVVVFNTKAKLDNSLKSEVLNYLSGVEKTFSVSEGLLYENMSRLLIPPIKNVSRFYLKNITEDGDSFIQEFCTVDSPETVVKIRVDGRKNVVLDYFNYSYL